MFVLPGLPGVLGRYSCHVIPDLAQTFQLGMQHNICSRVPAAGQFRYLRLFWQAPAYSISGLPARFPHPTPPLSLSIKSQPETNDCTLQGRSRKDALFLLKPGEQHTLNNVIQGRRQ